VKISRLAILLSVLLSLLVVIAADKFGIVRSNSIEVVQPTPRLPGSSSKHQTPAKAVAIHAEQLTGKRPLLSEAGEDLFYLPNAVAKPITPPSTSGLGPQKPFASLLRKMESSAIENPVPSLPSVPSSTILPAPKAPTFDFSAFGQYANEERKYLLIANGTVTRTAQIGETIDGVWRLISITHSAANWQHLPSGLHSTQVVPPLDPPPLQNTP
jgi:hypothetical protein